VNEIFDQLLADPTVAAVGVAMGGALLAVWLAAAWWAYADATRRTDNPFAAMLAAAWIIVSSPLLMPLSLGVYALARPQLTAAEKRTRRLTAELVNELDEAAADGCLSCGATVEPEWLRCPACTTWLALPCASCGAWSERTLTTCPYCAAEERGEPTVERPAAAPATARQRRTRRRLQAVGPGRQGMPRPDQRRPAVPRRRAGVPVAGR
jgi:hypothetical protein